MGRLWRYRRARRPANVHGGRRLHDLSSCSSAAWARHPLAATTLAFTVNNVAWVPMWGLGTAVSTMVGQQLGENRPDLAARATWTALVIALVYMGTMALLYVTRARLVPDGLRRGQPRRRSFGPLRDYDGRAAALRGRLLPVRRPERDLRQRDPRARATCGSSCSTTLVMSPPPLVAAWWGITRQGWGLIWCWIVITIWICLLGLIYLARFLQGRWRQMRVIEPEQGRDAGRGVVEGACPGGTK